ncbi:MAG: ASCH domain-containing protein [Opitutaceae bacterium]|nr:ASCH domain-containing protein [Opitutaceae bacterium]
MLFKQAILEKIAAGEVKVAYRRWRRLGVRVDSLLHTGVGLVRIKSIQPVDVLRLTQRDAKSAGYGSLEELRRTFPAEGTFYRLGLERVGDDPRIALRNRARLDPAERARLAAALARLDARSRAGPWVHRVLSTIAASPGTRAGVLAARLGCDKAWLKLQVRKLKNLGLTVSEPTGYRLSPRGAAWRDGRQG